MFLHRIQAERRGERREEERRGKGRRMERRGEKRRQTIKAETEVWIEVEGIDTVQK